MFKFIYVLGEKIRNPSLSVWYKFLKNSENWSYKDLRSYQLDRLKELVEYAKDNSEFYNQRYVDLTIKNFEEFGKLPILTKKDLINFNKKIHIDFKQEKSFLAKSSGSSGSSLKFSRNESADSFSRAAILRGYSWHHVKPYDYNLYFWGFNFSIFQKLKTRVLDGLQNRFRIFNFEDESFNRVLKKSKKIKYIHGYSSMVAELAKKVNSYGSISFPNLKMIKCTSEQIKSNYNKEINKAFNLPIVSEYGATESGIIAFSCKEGNMHITMEGVYVEEYENEILVTNLHLKTFPIIRYRLGDYIELEDEDYQCSCGLKHRVIKSVKGRVGASIHGQTKIYPSLTWYYIFKNLAEKGLTLNYQVIQIEKGKVLIRCSEELSHEGKEILQIEFQKYFQEDLTFILEEKYDFVLGKEKKKFFISKIDE